MYRIFDGGRNRTCQGLSRREALQVGAIGGLGLSLPQLFAAREARAAIQAGGLRVPDRDVNCIFIFLWGGPPQHELRDPKPEAPEEIRGPVKPLETNVSGIRIGEMLPRMAKIADRYVLVRSAHHEHDVHGNGAHWNQTGMPKQAGSENPNLGAVVSKFRGPRGAMPAFAAVGPVMTDAPVLPTGQEGGFLGNCYQPFRVLDPTAPPEKQPALAPPPGITVERLARRDQMLRRLDQLHRDVETDATRGMGAAYERAFSLTLSPSAKQAFDLGKEAAAVRDRYGRTPFGQGCLLARRLVEAGVRYVQVNWSEKPIENWGFDNHGDNLGRLKNQLPVLDQSLSALIEDLVQRGLHESTLVIVTGEFGRTPKINPSAGRDHWPYVYSYLIGGGGIAGGRVLGASDAQGAYPDTEPITPAMRAATVFSMMGLDVTVKLRAENVISAARGIPDLL